MADIDELRLDWLGDTPGCHRFVLVGDCCSGIPGGPHEATFAAIVKQMARLAPQPDFICFLGDHIMGGTSDRKPGADELRAQWRHWRDHEFATVRRNRIDTYHLTSNHNTFDRQSEDVFREVFPEIPRNGPDGDIGLSYHVTRGDDLLLVFTNSASARLGHGHVETEWLADVLDAHRAVRHKIVLGHYPVLPVNGYATYPDWRIEPRSGTALWRLLVEHQVLAYVCSHVIAFDARAQDGVLQICSAGAGTAYGPTGAFMRGPSQFFHFVACRLGDEGLRYAAIDADGVVRADLQWPPADPWNASQGTQRFALGPAAQNLALGGVAALRFEIAAVRSRPDDPAVGRETFVCGFDGDEGPPTVWIGVEGDRLVVELVMSPGGYVGRWVAGGGVGQERSIVEIRPTMGPGGVMVVDPAGRRTSLTSAVADDLGQIQWPRSWRSGQGPSGPADEPFRGNVEASMLVSVS